MVVYGWNERKIKQDAVNDKCTNCEGTEHVIQVNQKYFHIFWIPLFPIGKETYSVCTNCQNTLKLKEMTPELSESANRVKSETPFAAIWSFSGLGIIAIVAAIFSYQAKQSFKKEDGMLENPEVADVYVFKDDEAGGGIEMDVSEAGDTTWSYAPGDETEYYYGKVMSVRGDSVDFVYSNYSMTGGVPDKSDFKEQVAITPDFFDTETTSFHKEELVEMHHDKTIKDVYRLK